MISVVGVGIALQFRLLVVGNRMQSILVVG
jgi:hypothetical protein